MANLYGVANPVINLVFVDTIGTVTVTATAGVETNIFQANLTALDHGIYYGFCAFTGLVAFGPTQSTGMSWALRINNGADVASQTYNIPAAVANTSVSYQFIAVTPPMATAFWPPGGATLQVSLLVTGFNATVPVGYSKCVLGLFRAADQ